MRLLSISIVVVVVSAAGACGPSHHAGPDGGDDTGPCNPGTTEDCYSGAAITKDVGPCHGGTRTCDSGGTWGTCTGEVTPSGEVCGDSGGNNCNGTTDKDARA